MKRKDPKCLSNTLDISQNNPCGYPIRPILCRIWLDSLILSDELFLMAGYNRKFRSLNRFQKNTFVLCLLPENNAHHLFEKTVWLMDVTIWCFKLNSLANGTFYTMVSVFTFSIWLKWKIKIKSKRFRKFNKKEFQTHAFKYFSIDL